MQKNNNTKKHKKSLKRYIIRKVSKILSWRIFSDKFSIKVKYFLLMKKRLNLKNPKTFNEKLNWIKLYYRKDIMTTMVDKELVKPYVSKLIGPEFVIPLIASYDTWNEIDFDKLTPPFVIKTTHSSGDVFVVRDYKTFDFEKARERINESLKKNYFYGNREWPYKNVKPRIIVEEYVEDSIEPNLPVFKFFCFNGEPFLVQTIKNDKTADETIDYFDMNWKLLELTQNFNNSEKPLGKPANFEEMKVIAAKLSKGFPFVRVDLYSVNSKVYFSEFTFFSDAAYQKFHPEKWDLELGEKINLNLNEKFN